MRQPAAIHRQIKAGVRVRLTQAMGIKEGCVVYRYGTVKERNGGDDFLINVEYQGQSREHRISGIDAHRYLCEIDHAFIDGRWQEIWPK